MPDQMKGLGAVIGVYLVLVAMISIPILVLSAILNYLFGA